MKHLNNWKQFNEYDEFFPHTQDITMNVKKYLENKISLTIQNTENLVSVEEVVKSLNMDYTIVDCKHIRGDFELEDINREKDLIIFTNHVSKIQLDQYIKNLYADDIQFVIITNDDVPQPLSARTAMIN